MEATAVAVQVTIPSFGNGTRYCLKHPNVPSASNAMGPCHLSWDSISQFEAKRVEGHSSHKHPLRPIIALSLDLAQLVLRKNVL